MKRTRIATAHLYPDGSNVDVYILETEHETKVSDLGGTFQFLVNSMPGDVALTAMTHKVLARGMTMRDGRIEVPGGPGPSEVNAEASVERLAAVCAAVAADLVPSEMKPPPPRPIKLRIAPTPDRPADLPMPAYAHEGDAGLDLCAMDSWVINDDGPFLARTGLRVEIPAGYVGLVLPRSGLSKRGIVCATGVIDSGYRGEVLVNLRNASGEPYGMARGSRIAQLLVLPIARAEIEVVADLSPSERGTNGFGSTGR